MVGKGGPEKGLGGDGDTNFRRSTLGDWRRAPLNLVLRRHTGEILLGLNLRFTLRERAQVETYPGPRL